jgi:S-methylmethionine-dependent homocysteine/selenocysteine methylase
MSLHSRTRSPPADRVFEPHEVVEQSDTVRTYAQVIESGDVVLTDGANGTRLRFETGLELDPVLDIAGLAGDGRSYALQAVSGEYVAIATALGMPIQLDAPSYWVNPDRLAAAGRAGELEVLSRRCVEAAASNRDTFTGAEIFVAGVVGPKADGYAPTEIPSEDEAAGYHQAQAAALARAGVDVLYGETLSTASESAGLARAMAATECPYAIGPVIDRDGRLPDGTPLEAVIAAIENTVTPRPLHYFINCTHPVVALAGLTAVRERGGETTRVIGLKANGSAEPPTSLDQARSVRSDTPTDWALGMVELHERFGLRMLGGCCGTDSRHILALALALRSLIGADHTVH